MGQVVNSIEVKGNSIEVKGTVSCNDLIKFEIEHPVDKDKGMFAKVRVEWDELVKQIEAVRPNYGPLQQVKDEAKGPISIPLRAKIDAGVLQQAKQEVLKNEALLKYDLGTYCIDVTARVDFDELASMLQELVVELGIVQTDNAATARRLVEKAQRELKREEMLKETRENILKSFKNGAFMWPC